MKKTKLKALSLLLSGIVLITSCVKDEIFQGPPSISEFSIVPATPVVNEPVRVSAKITDMNGIKKVTLFYKEEGEANYTGTTMAEGNNSIYSAQIPGKPEGKVVQYYIEALNKVGIKAYHPSTAPASVSVYTVGSPQIVMNEIYSRGIASDPDWIELYNGADVAVDISGYKIYDNGGFSGTKPKMTFPAGTSIPAKGFLVIVTDIPVSIDPSGFGLSSNGEEVWLENNKGNVIDNVIFPALAVDQSYGRKPDGSANFFIFTQVTRGASNNNAATLP